MMLDNNRIHNTNADLKQLIVQSRLDFTDDADGCEVNIACYLAPATISYADCRHCGTMEYAQASSVE